MIQYYEDNRYYKMVRLVRPVIPFVFSSEGSPLFLKKQFYCFCFILDFHKLSLFRVFFHFKTVVSISSIFHRQRNDKVVFFKKKLKKKLRNPIPTAKLTVIRFNEAG